MALTHGKHSRVTVVLDDVKDLRLISGEFNKIREPTPRQGVEHAVLLNFPYLQGDQEAQILLSLYNLQFQFEGILQLAVGRVLNKQALATHALVIRFPSIEVLLAYYKSDVHANVSAKLAPFLHGRYTVDYLAPFPDHVHSGSLAAKWVNLTFIKFKEDLHPGAVDNVVKSISDLEQLPYIKQISVGANLIVRDNTFSHAFGLFLSSVEDLDRLLNDPGYVSIFNDKVGPASSKFHSVRFLAFVPVLTARL